MSCCATLAAACTASWLTPSPCRGVGAVAPSSARREAVPGTASAPCEELAAPPLAATRPRRAARRAAADALLGAPPSRALFATRSAWSSSERWIKELRAASRAASRALAPSVAPSPAPGNGGCPEFCMQKRRRQIPRWRLSQAAARRNQPALEFRRAQPHVVSARRRPDLPRVLRALVHERQFQWMRPAWQRACVSRTVQPSGCRRRRQRRDVAGKPIEGFPHPWQAPITFSSRITIRRLRFTRSEWPAALLAAAAGRRETAMHLLGLRRSWRRRRR